MLVVIPYPDGNEYLNLHIATATNSDVANQEYAHSFRASVMEYCQKVCQSPWESDELDILSKGVRIRLGSRKDFFMLQMKYGYIEEYK